MQNDFITGCLGSTDADEVANKVADYLSNRDTENESVYFTFDTHYAESYGFSQEGKVIPIHCVSGTKGWNLDDRIKHWLYDENTHEVAKNTFGDVFGLPAFIRLDLKEDSVIEIMGVCTDICVISNALILRANFPNVPIRVIANCCAGTSKEAHEAALKIMKQNMIEVVE